MGGVASTIGRVATDVGTGGMAEAVNAGTGGGVFGGGSGGKGGGKGGSSGPAIPDFAQAVQQQAQSGQQAVNAQTAANRPNQTNAFGATSNWAKDANGNWTQQTNLGGPLGAAASGIENQIANQGPLDTGTQARDQAITGAYNQAASRLDPRFSQAEESEKAMLANKGLDPGSQAYENEIGNFNRTKNDAYSSAMNGAIQQGTAAQQATFNENLAAKNNPFTQLGALSGLTQQQQVTPAGVSQAAQYLPAAMAQYQGGLQQYGIDQAGKNSLASGIGQLGGTAATAAILA